MTVERTATQLEKMVEKLEAISPILDKSENQNDFDSNKADAISLLNDMIELLHEDAEHKENDHEED